VHDNKSVLQAGKESPCAREGDENRQNGHARKNHCRPKNSSLYRIIAFLLALTYGATCSLIPNEDFKDFDNYLNYAQYAFARLSMLLDQGILVMFANEPIWLVINWALGSYLEPEAVVKVIILASSTIVAWLVLNSRPQYFIILVMFLLLPFVVKNHIMQLRQGVGVAFFLLGWFSSSRVFRVSFMGLAPLIHSSFFFILPIYFAAQVMIHWRLANDIRSIVFVLIAFGVSFGGIIIASQFGARQSYDFSVGDVSGFAFVMWSVIFAMFLIEGRAFLKAHVFEVGVIIFYLSSYWSFELSGRIFESGVLLVLLAGLCLTGWRRLSFVAMVLAMGIAVWSARVGEPGLGFMVA